jgi:hypothetical protein
MLFARLCSGAWRISAQAHSASAAGLPSLTLTLTLIVQRYSVFTMAVIHASASSSSTVNELMSGASLTRGPATLRIEMAVASMGAARSGGKRSTQPAAGP